MLVTEARRESHQTGQEKWLEGVCLHRVSGLNLMLQGCLNQMQGTNTKSVNGLFAVNECHQKREAQ